MAKFSLEAFPSNMKFARIVRDMTQESLAERSGISRAAITAYETRRGFPTLESAVRIAESLGVTVNDLVDTEYAASKRRLLSE